jgi:hypothetical protein
MNAILPYLGSIQNSVEINQLVQFVYFGVVVCEIKLWPDGDFYLISSSTPYQPYHIEPFNYKWNANKYFYFGEVPDPSELSPLSSKIKLAFPSYLNFSASTAYSITWDIYYQAASDPKKTVFYQVVLCTDMQSSFMIVTYQQLDFQSDAPTVYFDIYNNTHSIEVSTTDTNCNVPGQYVFQLNNIDCMFIEFTKKNIFKLTKKNESL